jgi:YVTN family beta-propeller protein
MINKQKLYSIALLSTAMILMLIGVAGAVPFAYITNQVDNTVSIIDTATNTVTATVSVGSNPVGVAVTPDGTRVYVTNRNGNSVSVINTATNTVIATVSVGSGPEGVAVTPDGSTVYVTNPNYATVSVINTTTNTVIATVSGLALYPEGLAVSSDGTKVYVASEIGGHVYVIDTATNALNATTSTINVGSQPFGVAAASDGKVYVTNNNGNSVSVIDTATNTVTATVPVGAGPWGVAVNKAGTKVYVTNQQDQTVSVIDTATNTVIATVNGILSPYGVSVTPDGSKAYAANSAQAKVYVIDTATNTVTTTVQVGTSPVAFGQFIGPLPFDIHKTQISISGTPSSVQSSVKISTFKPHNDAIGVTNSPDHRAVTAPNTLDVTVQVINAPASGSVTLSIAGNPVQTLAIPPGPIGQTVNLTFTGVASQNPTTDTITVNIYDVYGKNLIEGTMPVNSLTNTLAPISITYRDP